MLKLSEMDLQARWWYNERFLFYFGFVAEDGPLSLGQFFQTRLQSPSADNPWRSGIDYFRASQISFKNYLSATIAYGKQNLQAMWLYLVDTSLLP